MSWHSHANDFQIYFGPRILAGPKMQINFTPTLYKKMSAHLWCQITYVSCQRKHHQIWLGLLFHLLPKWAKPLGVMERCRVEMCSLACLPWASSLNCCLCHAAAYIPKTTVTHSEITPRRRIPVAQAGDEDYLGLGHSPDHPLAPH